MLELSRLRSQLPPLLSVIAGMVDLTGFLTLGNIFRLGLAAAGHPGRAGDRPALEVTVGKPR